MIYGPHEDNLTTCLEGVRFRLNPVDSLVATFKSKAMEDARQAQERAPRHRCGPARGRPLRQEEKRTRSSGITKRDNGRFMIFQHPHQCIN